jgi:FMN phosphatase YigB (HAD superfamily)
MRLRTVLFDLDNTLLVNDMDLFLPRYFSALGKHMRQLPNGDRWIMGLLAAMRIVVDTDHPDQTNEAVVWQHMEAVFGFDRNSADAILKAFYTDVFPELGAVATSAPAAKRAIELCFAQGVDVVIATNPLFPKAAIDERLRWAGIPPDVYDYKLITGYETMVAAKPTLAYYRQILAMLDANPMETLMIGDSWTNDIEPAAQLGISTYWIPTARQPEPADPNLPTASGTLEQFCDWFSAVTAGIDE